MSYWDGKPNYNLLPTLCKGAVPNDPPGCTMGTSGPDPHPWLHAFQADLHAVLHVVGVAVAWVFQFMQDVLHGVVLDVEGAAAIVVAIFVWTWLRELVRRKTPD